MSNQSSRGDVQAEAGDSDRVGTTGRELRAKREALGEELTDVAEVLCIRLDFLKSLEAGDYDQLPGAVYAVGFVRSYAKHLGMDPDQVAWQFKMELSGESPTAKLDFLTPVQESRIPRGAIVLVTVLLAATIYGVWYYMNARNLTFTDIIPEVPAQFGGTEKPPAAAASDGIGAEKGSAQADSAVSVGENVNPSPKPYAKVEDHVPGPAPKASPSPSEPAAGGPSSGPSGPIEPSPPAPVPAPTVPSETAASPAPVAEPTPVPEATALEPPKAPEENSAAASVRPAESAAVVSKAPVGNAPAEVSARIEIRAIADSWVQVRAGDGTLLMTRIVYKGSNFVLPAQQGLKLTTGNAGGLEILVDGVVVPSLGPFGAVRRDVSLDPERLKAGTALAR